MMTKLEKIIDSMLGVLLCSSAFGQTGITVTPSGSVTVPNVLTYQSTNVQEFDASQYTSGSAGTCTLGTNDNICIANAIQAISGIPGSTGGYGVIDASALGVNGSEVWTANPFDNIIDSGSAPHITTPQKCGTLLLNSGHSISEYAPLWIPRCWDVQWKTSYSQGGRGIIASAAWTPIFTGTSTNTGCNNLNCTVNTGTLVSIGQYQFTVTASANWSTGVTANFSSSSAIIGTTATYIAGQAIQFTTSVSLPTGFSVGTNYYVSPIGLIGGTQFEVTATPGGVGTPIVAGSGGSGTQTAYTVPIRGQMFAVCGSTGANSRNCGGNGLTTCGTACGSSAWGIILAVPSVNTVTVGTNNASHALANGPSNVNFVIWGDLVSLGSVSQTGSDGGGSSSTITGGAYNCNNNLNVGYALSDFSVQEKSYWKNVQIQGCDTSSMTVQSSGAVNSGPFEGMVMNMDATHCLVTTVPVIIRIPGNTRPVRNFTINADTANCANTGIDLEAGTDVADFHMEDNSAVVTPVNITAWTITGFGTSNNIATFTNSGTNGFVAGQQVMLTGFATSTFFNNQIVYVLSAGLSNTQFEVLFVHANGSATENGTATPDYNVVSIGQNAGGVPFTICPVMCVEPANFANGARVDGPILAGVFANVVLIGSGNNAGLSVLLENIQGNGTITNTINDLGVNCIISGTNGDNWLSFYSRNGQSNAPLTNAHSNSSSCLVNSAVLPGNGTTTSASLAAFTTNSLVMPTIGPNQTRYGQCDLIFQESATAAVVLGLHTSATSTGLQILGTTLYPTTSTGTNLLPPAVITMGGSNAIMASATPAATGTNYLLHANFSLITNGNANTLIVYGQVASGTLTLVQGSTCTWLPQ